MPSGCLTLFIINKAGGLIYTRHFSQDIAPLNVNDCLRLASTFHSMHAIAGRLTPVGPPTGIETLEADSFRLECYQSPTGIKFLMLAEPKVVALDALLKQIYIIFSDYVLKNPFYELDMPVQCDLFNIKVDALVQSK
ncbi:trafficking protein particle complex subunit 4 [Guillardia theta CCMP2712]|uniref:Trafficking protein particle complex subunit n=2 Tax=Guillardia theta TaxID=55529 RepID=L1I8E0_GUITC|nr:trafficking protein particle complex subunit 4 [Guillardia theta CCMP2712]EKX32498.1 trafficking protein particle complex subunit 4 [Guillardia theta CCMP2712]|mmetsp:Transcript_50745/g.158541  ORF Transcript_50745/g.158541 Transcript_50745/m.158541 type:complete len:137 (+) Transcript_50745:165-575(+)|eukprot:XP_005819478.1 trafficking protein particle complex subunit 4 [Guillardia theta CCMP2712]